jgi:hypothetical protein
MKWKPARRTLARYRGGGAAVWPHGLTWFYDYNSSSSQCDWIGQNFAKRMFFDKIWHEINLNTTFCPLFHASC